MDSDTRAAIVEEDGSRLCGGISNLFLCKGEPGKVVKIEVSVWCCLIILFISKAGLLQVSQRTGEQISLTQCLRSGLKRVAGVGGGRQLGLGGVFWVRRGSVKAHVNPDFEVTMLKFKMFRLSISYLL